MPLPSTARLSLSALAVVAFGGLCASARAGVVVVDASGAGDFADFASAIAAAADGDVLLAKSGSYAGFVVHDKSLDIVADAGASVLVIGAVRIENLAAARRVTLTGVRVAAGSTTAALRVASCAGPVRLQNCTVDGLDGPPCTTLLPGGTAVEVAGCADVALVGCSASGGDAGDYAGAQAGADGGRALDAGGSTLALYRCTLVGGDGASHFPGCLPNGSGDAGDGGTGAALHTCVAFASDSTIVGGDAGSDPALPGCRGSGVVADTGSVFRELACALATGAPPSGTESCSSAPAPLVLLSGSVAEALTGTARDLIAARTPREHEGLRIDVFGAPGERVELFYADSPAQRYDANAHGVVLLRLAHPTRVMQAGTIGTSGTLTVIRRAANLPAGVEARVLFVQALVVDATGRSTLTPPATVVQLDDVF